MQPFVFQDHAVKLHGRTYHYVPRTASRGGINVYIYNNELGTKITPNRYTILYF